jgi:hypothetical protein
MGPHPNPLSDLQLVKPCGGPVSLHRYAGRWVVVRVTDARPDPDTPVCEVPGVDFVPVNVVTGPIRAGQDDSLPVVFDPSDGFAQRFPAIARPATFVVDPEGRLVAILDDHGWPGFLRDLLRPTGRLPAHGAIDQQDITS